MCSDDRFLAAAHGIGRELTADAVWDSGRCAWIGAMADARRPWRVVCRALGPSAYDGTAGVGLFLAQLAAVTGDSPERMTALGALRHATERAPELSPVDRDGLQGGLIGVALAAVRAAALLGEPELESRARELLRDARLPSGHDRCPDVISGSAGAIAGLLALDRTLGEPALVELAASAGESLIEGATKTRHGWSWALPRHRFPHDLCGLSHGAAGIGWALLGLFGATGDLRFRDGANGAFEYVTSWRDLGTGAWPDLRVPGQRRGRPHPGPTDATGTWCHGEAGIALALLGSDDGRTALETTRRHLAGLLWYELEDLSLCHGAGGAADVVLTGAAAGGGRTDEAVALGHTVLERHVDGGDRWPCGVPNATTPGLFLGLSGIGWWLLRLYDGRVASPLGVWA